MTSILHSLSQKLPAQFLRGTLLVLLCLSGGGLQAAENPLEARVKAAYLVNLARYVSWPALPADALRICVMGSDMVGTLLRELPARLVQERPLQIVLNDEVAPASCHVLYVSAAEDWRTIVADLRGTSVLTVGDGVDFIRGGGIVGFFLEDGKVRLEISAEEAREANLRISANLMELARQAP